MSLLAGVLTVFSTTMINVFALGFQQKNVQHSRYVAAFFTSGFIALAQYTFIYFAVSLPATFFIPASALGGGCGIVLAIYVFDKLKARRERLAGAET